MNRLFVLFGLCILLSACATQPAAGAVASPCAAGEATYECQVERYYNVNVP